MIENSVSPRPVSPPRKILVAVDGSEESSKAAQYAIELAQKIKAELSVLHVVLLPEYISEEVSKRLEKELGSRGELALEKVRHFVEGKDVPIHEKLLTTRKAVVSTICEFASSNGAELIVMGTKGASGVANLLLGNVATGVAREARCPVLVVR